MQYGFKLKSNSKMHALDHDAIVSSLVTAPFALVPNATSPSPHSVLMELLKLPQDSTSDFNS